MLYGVCCFNCIACSQTVQQQHIASPDATMFGSLHALSLGAGSSNGTEETPEGHVDFDIKSSEYCVFRTSVGFAVVGNGLEDQ